MEQHGIADRGRLRVENIGGIDDCEIEFSPGVTVLTGRNATNRTSLLKALTGALGGSAATLKSDADEGEVELQLGDERYYRRLERTQGGVSVEGEPFTENEEVVDLFASLLESNPARRAIERDDNLREIIMRPVDTEAIERRIDELEQERSRLGNRISELDDEIERLPALEERRTRLKSELEDLDGEIQQLRETVNDHELDPNNADAAREAVSELEETRQELQQKRNQAETQRESLDALREERQELQTELDELEQEAATYADLDERIERLQNRERALSDTISDLSAIVEFNQNLLSGDTNPIAETEDTDVTAKLNPASESVECWTCGKTVERETIESKLEELRNVVSEKHNKQQEIKDEIAELRDKRNEREQRNKRRETIERSLEEIEAEIDRKKTQLEATEATIDNLVEEQEAARERVEKTEELRNSELLDNYERLSELEYERGQRETELNNVEDEISRIESLKRERSQLEAQQDEIREELEAQRTQITDLEKEAIDAFNEHMNAVLELLEYENIERVWIQRKEGAEFHSSHGGYRGGSVTQFDLNVVRETEDGSVYEDSIQHFSESERNVVGLVVALAGYLVHDVHQIVPVMLLDSLEAIDSERIAALVEYFSEYSPFLLVALLPEDAEALDDSYARLPADKLSS
ncbi:AAA family ATPase [Halobacteria archaeon AArc-xg1-1]|uniref:AAA family ATPase n=1 Tax=Natronoglomus mannanivorans TaxID=2979990 RepID=A0AAP2YZZ5_9EURY|nr:AAA family ATPase [Halobacteria archaeon AArc-xg1-1]